MTATSRTSSSVARGRRARPPDAARARRWSTTADGFVELELRSGATDEREQLARPIDVASAARRWTSRSAGPPGELDPGTRMVLPVVGRAAGLAAVFASWTVSRRTAEMLDRDEVAGPALRRRRAGAANRSSLARRSIMRWIVADDRTSATASGTSSKASGVCTMWARPSGQASANTLPTTSSIGT